MRRVGWGGVAHVFVAIALALPLVAAAAVLIISIRERDQSVLNQWTLAGIGVVFVVVVGWVGLLPFVRPVEVATARVLLGLELPDPRAADSWESRWRGARWLAVLVGTGLVVMLGLLYGIPIGIGLLLYPFSGVESLRMPGSQHVFTPGHGWIGMALAALGLLTLVLAAALVVAAAVILRRVAPRLLGPSLAERVVVAADRERELARANTLARELHDTLGHTLTAMTLQATAARRLLDRDPQAADQALVHVEELGRRAQADIDAVVGALRVGSTPGGRDPASSSLSSGPTRSLPALVQRLVTESVRQPGVISLPARLELPADVADAAYRIVQEGVTNAMRHGPGAADVALREERSGLVIEICNPIAEPGGEATQGPRQGSGLTGLRERAMLVGGTLDAGAEGGRWMLRAHLPIR